MCLDDVTLGPDSTAKAVGYKIFQRFVLTKVSVENRTAEGEDCWKSEKAGVYRRMRIDADILTL